MSAPPPIRGVSTNTVGFVGQTERGPTEPRLVTSWAEFLRWYGGMGQPEETSYLPPSVRGFFDNGGSRAFVARVTPATARPSTIQLPIGDGRALVLRTLGPGDQSGHLFAWLGRAPHWRFLGGLRRRTGRFRLVVARYETSPNIGPDGSPLVDPLTPGSGADRDATSPELVEEFDLTLNSPAGRVELDSALVTATIAPGSHSVRGVVRGAARNAPVYKPAGGGDDGRGDAPTLAAAMTLTDFIGESAMGDRAGAGLLGLENVDGISLITIPDEAHSGVSPAVRAGLTDAVVRHCEQHRDRFGLLQLDLTAGGGDLTTVASTVTTSFAAVYFPWLRVSDGRKGTMLVPPGGHVAGVIARSDAERGVHEAPANLDVRGIVSSDLPEGGPLSHDITDAIQSILNTRRINAIRDFRHAGRGIRVWGARTLSDDPEWKYVNVRRLFIFLERSIDEGTKWVAFEPNAEPTWAGMRQSVTNFLTQTWRGGGLAGAKPKEAFFVKCDRTTMTQSEIESGRLICEIGIAPIRPSEFVIFRIGQWTGEARR